MLHKAIRFFIDNTLVAALLVLTLLGWGVIHSPFFSSDSIIHDYLDPIAVDAIPDIGENQQIIFTKWEGLAPQDIEDQITYPLTSFLLGIPGVKTIRSSSMFGFSSIYIIFKEDIGFYWSRSRILEKLNSLPDKTLPEGIRPSLGPDATGLGQVYWYTLEGRDSIGNVTGGWDLHELRSIQDYYVKNALSSADGVAEVASVGGHIQEYQIDVQPEKMRQYGITLAQIVTAIKESNQDVGAQTLEINHVEYVVRGLGAIKSLAAIENTVVSSENFTALRIQDIATVSLGPASRRGILDKEGAEVVGGVVVARYGANPMEVIANIKEKIKVFGDGLPSKVLADGRISQLTVVPFYDRSTLIEETLDTLKEALTLEILITILVIIVMVFHLRAAVLVSGLLPLAVLMVFIAMKIFSVSANIVALSGIAIAIGTMVDMGVILAENMLRHLQDNELKKVENDIHLTTKEVIYNATTEVSGAIITAVLTTIISFIPVFLMIGAEGKLFRPLAFTKTIALFASLVIALFFIPPFATLLFRKANISKGLRYTLNGLLLIVGILSILLGYWLGLVLVTLSIIGFMLLSGRLSQKHGDKIRHLVSCSTIVFLLAMYWRPLGFEKDIFRNLLFVGLICFFILGLFSVFKKYYTQLLRWTLAHKLLFLIVPVTIFVLGVSLIRTIGQEFMPSLNEGSFLLMPTSLPHAGVEENKRVLQQLDMAVAALPEIATVVGKAGRTTSALDPAPLSMYETVIHYKPEYLRNENGEKQRYRINEQGLFVLKNGGVSRNPNNAVSKEAVASLSASRSKRFPVTQNDLIEDDGGEGYRNWRPRVRTPDDIWKEIVNVTRLPGVTVAPKLQPIETRLIMLQTGMRAPMGIKIKGQNLADIEAFGLQLEKILKQTEGVKADAVFADRIVGKPYVLIDINRNQLVRYGVSVMEVQQIIQIAVGGVPLIQTVEGRERYGVRVRYPRELRAHPDDLKNITVPIKNGKSVPLGDLATIRYEQGPQTIKSEDSFLVGYVLFDKITTIAEDEVIKNAQTRITEAIATGTLLVPKGINYEFTGTYENQLRARKTFSMVFPLVILLIFLILYFQFRSISTALMIFSGVLVAFAGGCIMLWLYGQDWFLNVTFFEVSLRSLFHIQTIHLSVAVGVGFIALFGIATDDGVVMATYLKQRFDHIQPKNKQDIVVVTLEAAEKRIRPCLMTTVTTILALLPILTASGKGSDIMIPMAIPIFGGMVIDITSYFLVPVLYSWREEIRIKKNNK